MLSIVEDFVSRPAWLDAIGIVVPSMPEKKPLVISKIVVDRDLCIGAATCVTIAPGAFRMDGENKAVLVDLRGNDAETILMAAESCPTKAIFLYDDEGLQIYPYI